MRLLMPIPKDDKPHLDHEAYLLELNPLDARDWDLIELGYTYAIWKQRGVEIRRTKAENEQLRVILLAARRMKIFAKNKSQVAHEISEAGICRVYNGKYILERTITRYLFEPKWGQEKPEHYIQAELSGNPFYVGYIDNEIREWERLNGKPINTGMPEGW
jgi:hypothetical protein